jgi:hypothetical protein
LLDLTSSDHNHKILALICQVFMSEILMVADGLRDRRTQA